MVDCPDAKLVFDFFEGRLRTSEGVTITDIHEFTDFELETDHNYIQWLFPNARASRINLDAPLLTSAASDAVRASYAAMANFRTSLALMTAFYERNDHWLRYSDHNHLRISRILETTARLQGQKEAEAFLGQIEKRIAITGASVHPTARRIWRQTLSDCALENAKHNRI